MTYKINFYLKRAFATQQQEAQKCNMYIIITKTIMRGINRSVMNNRTKIISKSKCWEEVAMSSVRKMS